MNTENFTYYIKNPASLYQITYQEMRSMVNKYPYCQNLRFLLVKKSQIENHKNFEKDLNLAATFSPDRSFFFKQIKKNVLMDAGEDNFRLQEDYLELLDLGVEMKDNELDPVAEEDRIQLDQKFNLIEEILPPDVSLGDSKTKKTLEEQLNTEFEENPIQKSEEQNAIFLEDLVKDHKINLNKTIEVQPEKKLEEIFPEEELMEVSEEEILSTETPIEIVVQKEIEGNLAPEDFHPEAQITENTSEYVPESVENKEEDTEETPPNTTDSAPQESSIIEKGSVLEFLIQQKSKVEEVDLKQFMEKEEIHELDPEVEDLTEFSKKIQTEEELIESLEITEAPIEENLTPKEEIEEIEELEEIISPSVDKLEEETLEQKKEIPFEVVPSNIITPSPKDSFESWMEKYNESNKKEKAAKKLKDKPKKDKSKEKKKAKVDKKKKKGKKKEKLKLSLKEAKKLTKSKKQESKVSKKKKKKKKSKTNKRKQLVKNIFEHKDIASETLAEILVKQESYDQAILVYKRLSLIFPEKSTYFAKKIDALEILKDQ